ILPHYLTILINDIFDPASTGFYALSLHDALPVGLPDRLRGAFEHEPGEPARLVPDAIPGHDPVHQAHREGPMGVDRLGQQEQLRSEEHTSELQSRENLVCRLLLEKTHLQVTRSGR